MAAAFLLVHTHLFSGNADVQYPSELGKFSYRVCCRTASDGCGTGAVHSPCRNAGLVETEDGNNGGRLRRHSKCRSIYDEDDRQKRLPFPGGAFNIITVLMAVTAPITELLMFYTFIRFLFPGRFLQLIILYIEAEQNRIPILYHIILAFHTDQAFFPGRCQRALL